MSLAAKSTQFVPPQDVVRQVTADNHSVTISWRKHDTAPLHSAYVLEWYPEGHKLEELRWIRLGRKDNHAVITGGTCRVAVNIRLFLFLPYCFFSSFFNVAIPPSFFIQILSHVSATREQYMF